MATISPLLNAPVDVQIHVLSASLSIALLPVTVFRKKRDRLHRQMGYLWVTAMAICALSSFWIRDISLIGPFSPIHGLSLFVLAGLYRGVRHAVRRDIPRHQRTMKSLSLWSLGIAGALTLLPGRIMHEVVFSQTGHLERILMAVVVIYLLYLCGAKLLPPRRLR